MKGEEQILELLAELLRKQDQTQETLQEMNTRLGGVETRLGGVETRLDSVETRLGGVETRLGSVEENQQAHQQILRTLALNQQKHQRELEGITDILDSVARMQRNQNRRLDRLENPSDFI